MIVFMLVFAGIIWLGGFTGLLVLKKLGFGLGRPLQVGHWLAVIMPLVMVLTLWLSYRHWSPLNAWIHTLSSSWVVLVIGFFMAAMLFGGLYAVGVRAGWAWLTPALASWLIIGTSLGYMTYGLINANLPRTHHVTVTVKADSPLAGKKIALVSDLHLGLTRRANLSQRAAERIMAESPDMVVIAGDIIDGPKIPYEAALDPLSALSAPLGVFYTPGNHEQYNPEPDQLYSDLPESITNLTDRHLTVDEITVMGIDYKSESNDELRTRLDRQQPDTVPDVVILHDPRTREVLKERGATLVLSGHTHGGQLFPSTVLVKSLYKEKTKGLVYDGDTAYYTTVGIGTGGVPARVGTRPEVVILEITAK